MKSGWFLVVGSLLLAGLVTFVTALTATLG